MSGMTTMKVPVDVRNRLMALARDHDRTLSAELAALIDDAEEREADAWDTGSTVRPG